jgi:acyl carrier protein
MQQPEVINRIQKVFDKVFLQTVVVTPELTANDVEEWDSLLHVSLILAIEEEFQTRFRVGEVEGTANVGELAALIAKRSALSKPS